MLRTTAGRDPERVPPPAPSAPIAGGGRREVWTRSPVRRSNDVEGFTHGYPMTHSDFWTLIDETLADSGGDNDRHRELLLAQLTALSPDEIASFEGRFHYYSELAADRASKPPKP